MQIWNYYEYKNLPIYKKEGWIITPIECNDGWRVINPYGIIYNKIFTDLSKAIRFVDEHMDYKLVSRNVIKYVVYTDVKDYCFNSIKEAARVYNKFAGLGLSVTLVKSSTFFGNQVIKYNRIGEYRPVLTRAYVYKFLKKRSNYNASHVYFELLTDKCERYRNGLIKSILHALDVGDIETTGAEYRDLVKYFVNLEV